MGNTLNTKENLEKLARFVGIQSSRYRDEMVHFVGGNNSGFNPLINTPKGAGDFEQVKTKLQDNTRWEIIVYYDRDGTVTALCSFYDVTLKKLVGYTQCIAKGLLAERYAVCEAVLKVLEQSGVKDA